MNTPIPYGRQHITAEDINAVVQVLKGDFLTQGPKIEEFENAFAEYIGCKYAVAVSNGTAALHLCALALDVKKGDKVITSPITFSASANCIRYCDGDIVFADIDPHTYLLNIDAVRLLLEAAPKGTYKGIIPVDFAGRSINTPAFRQLADKYSLWIIEDACHSPGGYFAGADDNKAKCGSGEFADLAIFSFHPVKHIACGEGGMITTNDPALYKRLLKLRTHGITRNTADFENDLSLAVGFPVSESENFPGWYMEMQELGYNYRLTDFQAALGLSQLSRADEGLKRRREIAKKYNEAFSGQSWLKGQSGVIEGHAYHLYVLEVEDRLGLYNFLRKANIFPQVHYVPVHLMPYYEHFGWKQGDFPFAEAYYQHCISLPMYPTLTDEEQQFVIKTVVEYYG